MDWDWNWWHVAWGIGCSGLGIAVGAVWTLWYVHRDRTDHRQR